LYRAKYTKITDALQLLAIKTVVKLGSKGKLECYKMISKNGVLQKMSMKVLCCGSLEILTPF